MRDSLTATTIHVTGYKGEDVEAYFASPHGDHSRAGMVVIHHMPGYDRATKEIVRRFAEMSYDAICPNLYWREAPGAEPADAAAAARALGGVPDKRLVGDVAGAGAYLRARPVSNGKLGVIGYCSGGRQAVLAACHTDFDAAIDCYGAFVTGEPNPAGTIKTNLVGDLPNLRAPLLGLFGADDKTPSPEHVAELDEILTSYGKPHEFYTYEDAAHAFFAVDRPSYRVAAANEGWTKIASFLGRHLEA